MPRALAPCLLLCTLCLLLLAACGEERGGGDEGSNNTANNLANNSANNANNNGNNANNEGPGTTPVPLDPAAFTWRLTEGGAALALWTTPATRKLTASDRPPEATRSGLALSAARGEYEPVQLALGPGTGSVRVEVEPFTGLDAGLELARVRYEGEWAEHLDPLGPDDAIPLSGERAEAVWLTVRVPDDAAAGEYEGALRVTPVGDAGAPVRVPVRLRVFNFSIAGPIHYLTQMNVSVQELIGPGEDVDDAKARLFGLRMTPKAVTWPSGFAPGITWENDRAPQRCEAFWDEPDEGDAYSIGALGPRYILGEGWNGVGFPSAMLFQFVDNSTPRPATFCGIERGDHLGTAAYNAEWSQFLGALQGYLREHRMLDRGYVYVQNEPQDDADHQLAAHLCRIYKAAAPDLRIAISEEPKPEIAEAAGGPCGYDIWIAHVRAYQREYAWRRQQDHGEQVWLYSLDHDPDPFFNPTRVDVQGMHQRVIPWVSWAERARGFAYYDAGRFFDGPRPTIRAALLREGFEDYEYLYLANGGAHPRPGVETDVDRTVAGVASSLTSWSRDPDAVMALRHELGLFLEGSRDTLPTLMSDDDTRPRQTWRINFQNPEGPPGADPLLIDGEPWLKVGWQPWDDALGYGWYGEHVTDPGIALYGYDEIDGYGEHQRSYLFDDYGRDSLFEFALPSGRWRVTVGLGRPARGYPGDPHNATVEGVQVAEDVVTTDAEPTFERTVEVDVNDGKLSLEVGGRSTTTGDWAYTFVAFLVLEPLPE